MPWPAARTPRRRRPIGPADPGGMDVRWLEDALADVRAIYLHIAADNPEAAARTVHRIRQAVDALGSLGDRGRPGRWPGTRELVIAGTPDIVPYRMQGEAIEILRFSTAPGGGRLGSVDILPQQDASGDEMDEGEIAARQFLEAGEDPPVVLHEAEQVLDLVALLVELPVGRALVEAGGSGRDHRQGASGRDGLAGSRRCRRPCRRSPLGRRGGRAGAGLAARRPAARRSGGRPAGCRGRPAAVQLGGEAAARAAKRLLAFGFFAPAAQAWARTTVLSSITHSRSASAAR